MNLSGSPVDYLAAFLGGLLVSFTPCVYPLIPISAGYIGATSSGSKLKGLALGFSYVTGMAITYAILGIFASLTGTIFGTVSTSPVTYFVVGTVIIVFGLSLLDFFIIPLPNIIKLPSLKKGDYLSTFLLGLSSGLLVSPCITPVLGSILLYLTTKKNILYGATLLFSFAYGMGMVLILAGVFSSAVLTRISKYGRWMVYIKRGFSFAIIAMGLYFIYLGIRRL